MQRSQANSGTLTVAMILGSANVLCAGVSAAQGELQQLIDAAEDGTTIQLEGRRYESAESVYFVGREKLILRGREGTEIVCTDANLPVIKLYRGHSIELLNFTAHHAETPGACGGSVIDLADTKNSAIRGCVLDGCGATGVSANGADGLVIDDTVLRSNSSHALNLISMPRVYLNNIQIHSNGAALVRSEVEEIRSRNVVLEGRIVDLNSEILVELEAKPQDDALWRAVCGGEEDTLRELLAADGAATINDLRNGFTLLHAAVWNRYPNIVGLLLASGADPRVRDTPRDESPLAFAARTGQVSLLKGFVEHGASVYRVSREGYCVMKDAETEGSDLPEALQAAGIVDEYSLHDERAADLFLAIETEDDAKALELIADGVDLRVRIGGNQALHVAAQKGSLPVVKALVEAGAPLDRPSEFGSVPVMLAMGSEMGEAALFLLKASDPTLRHQSGGNLLLYANDDTLDVLLEHGVPVDAFGQSSFRETLLHKAASLGSARMTQLALEAGASVDQQCTWGSAIHRAASRGHAPVVQLLVDAGADLNEGTWLTGSPVGEAAKAGHLDCVSILVAAGADLEVSTRDGETALLMAVGAGQPEAVNILLAAGANELATAEYGGSLLHLAAGKGFDALVTRLLDQGWEVDKTDRFKGTPLHNAANGHSTSTVRLLLERGADVEAVGTVYDRTPLACALSGGSDEVIDALRQGGAVLDPYQRDSEGLTLLHFASSGGHLKEMRELLRAGADVNARCYKSEGDQTPDRTPLYCAVSTDKTMAASMLLQAKADVNTPAHYGPTPLHEAHGWSDAMTGQVLLAAGADPDYGGVDQSPPIFQALRWRKEEFLRLLLTAGADPNIQYDGSTPLHAAARKEEAELSAWLLDYGADPAKTNKDGKTPREIALEEGNAETAEVLRIRSGAELEQAVDALDLAALERALAAGANPSHVFEDGFTALHRLSKSGSEGLEAARILLAAGADPNALSSSGQTPLLRFMRPRADIEFVRLLLEAGADPALGSPSAESMAPRTRNEELQALIAKGPGIPSVPIIGRGGRPHPAAQAAAKGARLAAIGDLAGALVQLDIAVEDKTRNVQYRFLRARLRASTGDLDGAQEDFVAINREKYDWLDPHVELANLLLGKGKFAEGLEHLNFVLNRYFGPPNARLLFSRGVAYMNLDRAADALVDLSAANRASEGNGEILRFLGFAQHTTGDAEAACQSWQAAAKVGDPAAPQLLQQHCQ